MHLHTFFSRDNNLDAGIIEATWTNTLLQYGQNGVLVFFAISGFVLGLPFVNQYRKGGRKVNIGAYFKRRLTRLEPPYVFFLTAFLFVHFIMSERSVVENFQHYFAGLTYTHWFVYGQWNPILPVSWSLETEVQFYILAPLIALIFKIKNRVALYSAFGVIVLALIYLGIHYKDLYEQINLDMSVFYYGSFFLIGFVFAEFFMFFREFLNKKHWMWDLVFFAALAGIFVYTRDLPQPRYFRTFLILPLFIGVFKGPIANWLMTRKFVAVTGGMCYTMYLLHYPLIHIIAKPFAPFFNDYNLSYWAMAAIVLPIIWFISAFFFAVLERPCMDKDWPTKLSNWVKYKLK